jgi:hypothetical protein
MLLILLPTAWLAVVTFFVVICQMAARGDAVAAPAPRPPGGRLLKRGVRVWENVPALRAAGGADHAVRRRARAQSTRTAGRANATHARQSRSHAGH